MKVFLNILTEDTLEMFYLNSTLNFGIPPVLVFQLEVYYKQGLVKGEKFPTPSTDSTLI